MANYVDDLGVSDIVDDNSVHLFIDTNGIFWGIAGTGITTTSIVTSANPINFGSSATFTATVLASSGGAPTGTVSFLDGVTSIGSGSLSSGVAAFGTTSLAVGSHSMTAAYGGDLNYATSTSSALTETVNSVSPATRLVVFTTMMVVMLVSKTVLYQTIADPIRVPAAVVQPSVQVKFYSSQMPQVFSKRFLYQSIADPVNASPPAVVTGCATPAQVQAIANQITALQASVNAISTKIDILLTG